MAIERARVSAQPACPLAARIRLQSSVGAGVAGGAGVLSGAGSPERSVFDSSNQLAGAGGGLGIGGGGYFGAAADFLASFLGGLGAGGIRGWRRASARGAVTLASTSTLSPSLIARKLGAPRAGRVCTLNSPYVVAIPCEGISRARAASSFRLAISSGPSNCRASTQPSAPLGARTRRNSARLCCRISRRSPWRTVATAAASGGISARSFSSAGPT